MSTKNSKRILEVKIKHMVDESPDTSWLGEYSSRAKTEFAIDRAHSEDCASVRDDIRQAKQTLEHVQQTIGDLHNAVLAQYNGTLANEKLDSERDALDDAYNEVGELIDTVDECDCGEHGDLERGQYRYFNPGTVEKFDPAATWIPAEVTDKKAYWNKAMRQNAKQDYERMEKYNAGDFAFIGVSASAQIAIPTAPGNGILQDIHSGGLWGIESDSDKSYIAEVEGEQLSELKEQLTALGFSKRAIATAFKTVKHSE